MHLAALSHPTPWHPAVDAVLMQAGRPKPLGGVTGVSVRSAGLSGASNAVPFPFPAGRPSVRLEGVLGASTGGRWHLPWRLPMAGRWLDAGRKKAPVQRQGLGLPGRLG